MRRWLQITSGRGPAECCWVDAQVAREIAREAIDSGLEAELLEAIPGSMPGTFKSALIAIDGSGDVSKFVSNWNGTVQWIGNSMLRPGHKRRNWFIGISVLEPPAPKQWRPDEIKVECMRASGPGGQHVNKTASAVRVTHMPSGLRAVAREERSQHLNKKLAMVRLAKLIRQTREEEHKHHAKCRWKTHDRLERGNAVLVFKGARFEARL